MTLKDRDNAQRSHARSRGKTRKPGATTKAEISPEMHFPSHVQFSQNDALSKPKSNKSPPCSITSPKNSPPCWHMHTSSLNKPKAPPEAETPPEQMLCNECNAGGVSEISQGYNDLSNI